MLKTIPENLFLMHPGCWPLLKGDRNNPILSRRCRGTYFGVCLFVGLGLGLLIVSFLILQPPPQPAKDIYGIPSPPLPRRGIEDFLAVFAMALFLFCAAGWLLYTTLKRRTLEKTGRLLLGKLVSVKLRYSKQGYMVVVSYHFKNPEGIVLTGKSKNLRSNLKKRVLPSPGTPVAVLYARDDYFDIL